MMTQQGQWQLTGSAAELYEQIVVPYHFDAWAMELVEQMAIMRPEYFSSALLIAT